MDVAINYEHRAGLSGKIYHGPLGKKALGGNDAGRLATDIKNAVRL